MKCYPEKVTCRKVCVECTCEHAHMQILLEDLQQMVFNVGDYNGP